MLRLEMAAATDPMLDGKLARHALGKTCTIEGVPACLECTAAVYRCREDAGSASMLPGSGCKQGQGRYGTCVTCAANPHHTLRLACTIPMLLP